MTLDAAAKELANVVLRDGHGPAIHLAKQVIASLDRRQNVRRTSGAKGGRQKRWKATFQNGIWSVQDKTGTVHGTFVVSENGRMRRLSGSKSAVVARAARLAERKARWRSNAAEAIP